MRDENHPLDKWRYVALFLTGIIISVADQLSKAWIRANIPEGGALFEAGIFRITNLQNTGAAFGLFQGQSLILTIIALAGIILVLAYAFVIYRRFPVFTGKLGYFALGLILGGTAGNAIDRILRGYVTDFIDFTFWPAFNVADSAVTVSVIMLAYCLLRSPRIEKYQDGQDL